jgi:peptidoglycan/LPS O-acetylase OafA/YrhL
VTLGDGLRPGKNSLNALRLVLAVAVIVSHSWPIGGWGTEPGLGGVTLGT